MGWAIPSSDAAGAEHDDGSPGHDDESASHDESTGHDESSRNDGWPAAATTFSHGRVQDL